jgi:hypothetical protein
MSITARLSRLSVLYSQKMMRLLHRVNNRCTMHDFQNVALEWVHGNQNDAHYYSVVTLPDYISFIFLALLPI